MSYAEPDVTSVRTSLTLAISVAYLVRRVQQPPQDRQRRRQRPNESTRMSPVKIRAIRAGAATRRCQFKVAPANRASEHALLFDGLPAAHASSPPVGWSR